MLFFSFQNTGPSGIRLGLPHRDLPQAVLLHRSESMIMPAQIDACPIFPQRQAQSLRPGGALVPFLRKDGMMPAYNHRRSLRKRCQHLPDPFDRFFSKPAVRQEGTVRIRLVCIQQKQASTLFRHHRAACGPHIQAESPLTAIGAIHGDVFFRPEESSVVMVPRNNIYLRPRPAFNLARPLQHLRVRVVGIISDHQNRIPSRCRLHDRFHHFRVLLGIPGQVGIRQSQYTLGFANRRPGQQGTEKEGQQQHHSSHEPLLSFPPGISF